MPTFRRLDQQPTGGYDGSGIIPSNSGPVQPRSGQVAALDPNLQNFSLSRPTGPMPTVPSGGVPMSPVPRPLPTGAPQTPTGGYDGSGINPQAGTGFQLPGINGQQYVAQSYGTNQTSPAIPTANWQNLIQNLPQESWNNMSPVATGTSPGVSPVNPRSGGIVDDPSLAGGRVQGYLDDLLNSGNPYLTNAARRGLETANSRGLLNSSIAAGSSTRSAIEAAQPILNEIMGLNNAREQMRFTGGENAADRDLQSQLQAQNLNFTGGQNDLNRGLQAAMQAAGFNFEGQQNALQRNLTASLQQQGWSFEAAQNEAQRQVQVLLDREGRAFSGEQAALDRTQGVNNALLSSELNLRNLQATNYYSQQAAQQDYEFRRAMQSDSVAQQDWLSSQTFSREFNAALSMLPIQNASQLHNYMMQAALEQPEVYTPEVLSGFSNFFNNQFLAQMQMYFPQSSGDIP